MGRKALEPLVDEIGQGARTRDPLLSCPANVTEKTKRAFERFVEEMRLAGIECEWRVVPADVGRELTARVLFDDSSAWELPPLNSLSPGWNSRFHSAPPRCHASRSRVPWQRGEAVSGGTPASSRIP